MAGVVFGGWLSHRRRKKRTGAGIARSGGGAQAAFCSNGGGGIALFIGFFAGRKARAILGYSSGFTPISLRRKSIRSAASLSPCLKDSISCGVKAPGTQEESSFSLGEGEVVSAVDVLLS
jgi:hypothetical protein